jgi:hypothetical protein
MVKRLLNWIAGLMRPKVTGPLGDVRLEVVDADGKAKEHRFAAGRSRREPVIHGYCAIEKSED